jgi:poly(hydroxyalkanoate) depolymerase family esterase
MQRSFRGIVRRLPRRPVLACVVLTAALGLVPTTALALGGTGLSPWSSKLSLPSGKLSLPGGGLSLGRTGLSSGMYAGGGGSLRYQLYVPSTYRSAGVLGRGGGTSMPLVVALHGCVQTADVFRQQTRWDQVAERNGFIVVFPEQSKSANYLSCWNFFQPTDTQRGSGEPAEIAGLTQSIMRRYSIAAHRVYVAGFSAGAAMASVMAATYPDLFSAVGVGSGCEYDASAACAGFKGIDPQVAGRNAFQAMGSQARVMPFIVFHGDADTTVPPVNASQVVQQWLLTDDMADDGSANGSIPRSPVSSGTGAGPGRTYTMTSWANARGGSLGQLFMVHGMKHAWSGGCACQSYTDPAGPDETSKMWAFFAVH